MVSAPKLVHYVGHYTISLQNSRSLQHKILNCMLHNSTRCIILVLSTDYYLLLWNSSVTWNITVLYFQAHASRQLIYFTTTNCFAESVMTQDSFETVCLLEVLLKRQFIFTRSNFVAARADGFSSFLRKPPSWFLGDDSIFQYHQQVLPKRQAVLALPCLIFSLFIENVRNHLSQDVYHILEYQHPRLHRCKNHKSYNKSVVKSCFTCRYVVNFEEI
jgi:hypothetical protein